MVKKIVLNGVFPVNCYIILKNDKCFIVDPGSEYDALKLELEKLNNPEILGILLTHAHLDHVGDVGYLKDYPIYMHEKELIVFKRTDLSLWDEFDEEINFNYKDLNIKLLKDNDLIPFDDEFIKVIHTPGHTQGGASYLYKDNLFSGDTLFNKSVGRTDFPTGSEIELGKSLLKLIDNLDENVKVYPGHYEKTTIKEEKENNTFYKYYKKLFK